ncbi:MAG TPA: DUF2934 domain-containing protein [Opitutaceae bacterium]|nr:DUF2934 domain-containing protein [Opitutaceae bacterium]
MNPSHLHPSIAADFPQDDLLRLEIKVAQRADELTERHGGLPGRDLEHWLQAEHEILEADGEDSSATRLI